MSNMCTIIKRHILSISKTNNNLLIKKRITWFWLTWNECFWMLAADNKNENHPEKFSFQTAPNVFSSWEAANFCRHGSNIKVSNHFFKSCSWKSRINLSFHNVATIIRCWFNQRLSNNMRTCCHCCLISDHLLEGAWSSNFNASHKISGAIMETDWQEKVLLSVGNNRNTNANTYWQEKVLLPVAIFLTGNSQSGNCQWETKLNLSVSGFSRTGRLRRNTQVQLFQSFARQLPEDCF